MRDAQIALPDDGDAIEDGEEAHALRQTGWRARLAVALVASWDRAEAGEGDTEDEQPKRWLDRAHKDVGRVVQELARLPFGDGERLGNKSEGLAYRTCPIGCALVAGGRSANQVVGQSGARVKSH